MKPIQIPLSYSTIDAEGLMAVLKKFEGKPHEQIITAFENQLCEITSSPFAVALNSGTSAIHLALKAEGVNKDDLVPVSTFTYVGSVNPIYYLGARPIFIDSESETWNMDPSLLEICLKDLAKQNKLPKAIVVVHAYGMPAKMKEIEAITKPLGIKIIEDAAEALGSIYFGQSAGSLGDIGVLSFNNNKTITSFGGGALLTKSKSIYDKVKFWATQAREAQPYYNHKEVGFNYRMSSLNAAYGLSQLAHIKLKIEQRRATFDYYKQHLPSPKFTFQEELEGFYSSRWLTTVLFKDKNPLKVQSKLAEEGVESRPLWNPMHCQPAFVGEMAYMNGVAERLFETGLCLPSGGESKIGEVQKTVIGKMMQGYG
jgi:UDP-N-acetylbacillosamine transaminase